MYVILQLQHSVGDVSNSTSSTVQSLTELVVFFFNSFSLLLFTFTFNSHLPLYKYINIRYGQTNLQSARSRTPITEHNVFRRHVHHLIRRERIFTLLHLLMLNMELPTHETRIAINEKTTERKKENYAHILNGNF